MTTTTTTTPEDGLTQRVYAAIPDYDRYGLAIERLEKLSKTPPPKVAGRDAILDEVRQSVLAGEPIPDDLGQRLLDADRAGDAHRAAIEALGWKRARTGTGLLGELINERAELVRTHLDTAFSVLRDELDEIITAVADIDRALGRVRSAEDVVRAPQHLDAWHALSTLVDRYHELRVAQADFYMNHSGTYAPSDLMVNAGCVKNILALDAGWLNRTRSDPSRMRAGISAVWPSPVHRDEMSSPWCWPTNDRPAYLRWLATSDAEPWLPTPDQAVNHFAEMQKIRLGAPVTSQTIPDSGNFAKSSDPPRKLSPEEKGLGIVLDHQRELSKTSDPS